MDKKLYDLSFPQKNILMREQFYSNTPINNISYAFYIKDDLNLDICRKVLNKIVKVNEGFRTQIITNKDGVFQYIIPFKNEVFEKVSLPTASIDDLKASMEKEAQIPFILENSKLYKIIIYKIKDNETVLFFKMHHLISDAWTTKIVYEEFNSLYIKYSKVSKSKKDNELLDNNKELIDLMHSDESHYINKYSSINYVETEKNYFESKNYEEDKKFWADYVEDIPEAISFKENATKKTISAKRFEEKVSISKDIDKFCKDHNISPYHFFLATFALYFYKTQSKTDFTIGTPLLNRKNKSEKYTLGMMVSTIPLKIHIDEKLAFIDFAKKISKDIFQIMRHERFPYEKILSLAHKTNNDTSNLFDIIISFQNIKAPERLPYVIENLWNFSASQQTSFELHISDYNDEGYYNFHLDYNENFCNQKEIRYVYNRMINIAKEVMSNDLIRLKEIELLDKEEKDLVIKQFNNMDSFSPRETLYEKILQSVKKYPNKVALKYEGESLTYKELETRVNIMAKHLLDNGVKGNMPVTLLLERSLDMVISMLAVLRIGAYYITIDPAWPSERINYIAENSQSKLIITHRKYAEFYSYMSFLCVEDLDYSKKIESNDLSKISNLKSNMSDFIYAIYTSGSTGKPKGTMMTNINIANLLNSTYKLFKQNDKDTWSLFHTYTFDFSQWETYGCLTTGGTLVIVPQKTTINPEQFIELLNREKVTILNQTPAYFYKVVEQDSLDGNKLENIRLVILGGESVFAKPLEPFRRKYPGAIIYNGYGPTETTIFAIMGEITDHDLEENNIYIGYPLLNYMITITNKNLEPLGIGLEGEICIQSKSVCSGYFNNPKMTKEKFIPDFNGSNLCLYKTGDVGYWDTDGRIKYIGRNDNQVKIRGFRIELEEIEKQLLNCPDVTKAVVFSVENTNLTKSLVGFIETKHKNYIQDVLSMIKKNLTYYMIPKLYQLEEFPLNFNGKIDRKKLFEYMQIEKKNFEQPKTNLEKEIAKYICDIKKLDTISANDDFIDDLGMDSLDIMQLSTDLIKYNVPIQRINTNSSIQKLAKSILTHSQDPSYFDEFYNIDIQNLSFKFDLSNIFITGGTGFLGAHIFKQLVQNTKVKNIYFLIRPKGNINTQKRFDNIMDFYFEKLKGFKLEKYLDKIHLVEGNFEEPFLGLNFTDYQDLAENITTIIHAGANVNHFGNFDSFYKTNVVGTDNIIKLAYDSKAALAHISTISVGGFSKIDSKNILDENHINVNQYFDNQVYMITKYEAECKVLDAISKGQIKAKIFRLGNIMPRVKDGKFQINADKNAFIMRLKTISKIKVCPEALKNYKIDLSPVDLCAKAINKLMLSTAKQTIYHIISDNQIELKYLLKDKKIKYVDVKMALDLIKKDNNPYNAMLLNDMLNTDYVETLVDSRKTIKILHNNLFNWNKVNKKYKKAIFELIEK